jgi:hypothetical protein
MGGALNRFSMPFARIEDMKSLPFSVFKRAGRPCYLVAFKNEATGEYFPAISTRKKDEAEAVKTAFAWLRDGIPRKRPENKNESRGGNLDRGIEAGGMDKKLRADRISGGLGLCSFFVRLLGLG